MTDRVVAWREPPPRPAELIRWPDGFGRRFLIWCDVEEEFDWVAPFTRDRHAVTNIAALPAMHRRFAAHGVRPIYMIDYPVVASPHAVALIAPLLADGGGLGAQLHPWTNPPFIEPLGPVHSFLGNLPIDVQAAKIDVLTAALTGAFGQRPRAFRAGRYGISADTRRLLAERGYRIDSSVRARHDYRRIGGPNFSPVGNAAYRRDNVVELPVSTVFTGSLRGAASALYGIAGALPRGRGLLARAGLVNRVALTPEGMPIGEAVAAVGAALADDERLLSFSFHSSSLIAGHTPFVRDAVGAVRFRQWWDIMLPHLASCGMTPATLDDILAITA